MKRFLTRVFRFLATLYACYLLALLILIALFKFAIPQFHSDKGNFSREYQEAFQKYDADILIVGSSRAAASLDPAIVSDELDLRSYNLAFNQANLTYCYHLLQFYLDACEQPPKYVILDVSWFSFDSRRLSYKEYASYFVFNRPKLYYDDLLLNKRRQLVNGLVTLGRSLERRQQPDLNFDMTNTRFQNQDSTHKSYVFGPLSEGFLRTFPDASAQMLEKEMIALEKIKELLGTKKVSLIFYTSPEDALFSRSQKNREEVYNFLREMVSPGVWMDYSPGGNYYSKNYENLMRDSHHIYYKALFSRIFASDLRQELTPQKVSIE
jgi:hypothetical protein